MTKTADLLRVAPEQLAERVAQLVEDRKKAERDMTQLRRRIAAGGAGNDSGAESKAGVNVINGVTFVGRLLEDTPARELKSMADEIKSSREKAVICLAWRLMPARRPLWWRSRPTTDQKNAVDLVKIGSTVLGGGGGGGRSDMAQAGGPNADKAADALKAVSAAL